MYYTYFYLLFIIPYFVLCNPDTRGTYSRVHTQTHTNTNKRTARPDKVRCGLTPPCVCCQDGGSPSGLVSPITCACLYPEPAPSLSDRAPESSADQRLKHHARLVDDDCRPEPPRGDGDAAASSGAAGPLGWLLHTPSCPSPARQSAQSEASFCGT